MTQDSVGRRNFLKVLAAGIMATVGLRLARKPAQASEAVGSSPHQWRNGAYLVVSGQFAPIRNKYSKAKLTVPPSRGGLTACIAASRGPPTAGGAGCIRRSLLYTRPPRVAGWQTRLP